MASPSAVESVGLGPPLPVSVAAIAADDGDARNLVAEWARSRLGLGAGVDTCLSKVSGGLNNHAFRVGAGGPLLKLYGDGAETPGLTCRERERRLMEYVGELLPGMGKRLISVFDGGHFEEWIDGAPITFATMLEPHGSSIAGLLGRLHALPTPPDQDVALASLRFWDDMVAWAETLPSAWPSGLTAPTGSALLADVRWLRGVVRPSPCALCHRDVHAMNLILSSDGSLRLIDWEFACVAPRAFDVVNFFLECCFVEETEGWDWSRVPSPEQRLGFAREYSAHLGAGDGQVHSQEAIVESLLSEWDESWSLVAHLWNILWALQVVHANSSDNGGAVGEGFDYGSYAAARWQQYCLEKAAWVGMRSSEAMAGHEVL